MSNVKIQGNASGSGTLTIQAPNTNTDRTMNLPDVAGDIITTGDTGTVDTAMIADSAIHTVKLADSNITAAKLDGAQTGTAPIFGVRAWVHFNGGGTLNMEGSGNVSSVSDNGVGRYMVNFATALPNEHYSVQCEAQAKDGNDDRNILIAHECKWTSRNRSTTQFPLDVGDWLIGGYAGTLQDGNSINFMAIC